MAKKTPVAAASTAILVATVQIKGGGVTVEAGGELTEALLKEMGLDQDEAELARLKVRGFVKMTTVRAAEPAPEAAALKSATDRAEAAEAKVADLQKQVDQLTADLAAAKKPA